MSLSEEDIEKLEELLFSEESLEDSLDYFGFHGLVCASVVGPKALSAEQIITILFADAKPSNLAQHKEHLLFCITSISKTLLDSFDENEEPKLPYEDEEEIDSCLQSWCIGFIEGFFCYEDLWFKDDESIAAELLMPMMVLSGLFEDDEFKQISHNDKLMTQFETIIPDQLTNIFLYYHTR